MKALKDFAFASAALAGIVLGCVAWVLIPAAIFDAVAPYSLIEMASPYARLYVLLMYVSYVFSLAGIMVGWRKNEPL